jgi:hypothetical protein
VETIDYISFYAKPQSTGLQTHIAYCFRATIGPGLDLREMGNNLPHKYLYGCDGFDEAEHERLLRGPDETAHIIFTQMSDEGKSSHVPQNNHVALLAYAILLERKTTPFRPSKLPPLSIPI